MSDLEIPAEAVRAADIWSGQIPRTDLLQSLAAAVPLAVAAELDRIAETWQGNLPVSGTYVSKSLRARARELRGQP
jgi:hypothetical protein